MKLFKLALALFLTLSSSFVFALDKTEVITYKPAIPAGKPQLGKCWTESIAVARPNTWRCMIGNEIQDPCFGTDDKNIVVCGVDPLKNNKGFAVQLTEPLPKSNNVAAANQLWMVELEDKSVCTPFTGTLPFVDQKPVRFGCTHACPDKQKCDKMAGLFSIDTQSPTWLAKKVVYSGAANKVKVEKIENVAVKKAWQ